MPEPPLGQALSLTLLSGRFVCECSVNDARDMGLELGLELLEQ
jgi:hypothetical protein